MKRNDKQDCHPTNRVNGIGTFGPLQYAHFEMLQSGQYDKTTLVFFIPISKRNLVQLAL
jgi:hypothetical protein